MDFLYSISVLANICFSFCLLAIIYKLQDILDKFANNQIPRRELRDNVTSEASLRSIPKNNINSDDALKIFTHNFIGGAKETRSFETNINTEIHKTENLIIKNNDGEEIFYEEDLNIDAATQYEVGSTNLDPDNDVDDINKDIKKYLAAKLKNEHNSTTVKTELLAADITSSDTLVADKNAKLLENSISMSNNFRNAITNRAKDPKSQKFVNAVFDKINDVLVDHLDPEGDAKKESPDNDKKKELPNNDDKKELPDNEKKELLNNDRNNELSDNDKIDDKNRFEADESKTPKLDDKKSELDDNDKKSNMSKFEEKKEDKKKEPDNKKSKTIKLEDKESVIVESDSKNLDKKSDSKRLYKRK